MAGNEARGDVVKWPILAGVVDRDDVRMLQLGRVLGLTLESPDHVVGIQLFGLGHLEGHGAFQRGVERLVDPTEGALPQQLLHLEPSNLSWQTRVLASRFVPCLRGFLGGFRHTIRPRHGLISCWHYRFRAARHVKDGWGPGRIAFNGKVERGRERKNPVCRRQIQRLWLLLVRTGRLSNGQVERGCGEGRPPARRKGSSTLRTPRLLLT